MTNLIAVNGPAGSGKTTQFAIPQIAQTTNLLNLVVISTKTLANEWVEHLSKHSIPSCVAFYDDLGNTSVQDYLKNNLPLLERSGEKQVLIISDVTYRKLNASDVALWDVYDDELPSIVDSRLVNYDDTVIESDYFNIINDVVTLTDKAKNTDNHLGINRNLNELIQILKTDRFTVSRLSYNKDKNFASYLITPNKNYYIGKNVYVLGADASSHPLLKTAEVITLQSPNNNHYSDLITISYTIDKNNSKTFRNDNPEVMEEVNQAIVKYIDGRKAIYAANESDTVRIVKSYTTPNIDFATNFTPISVLSAGLNIFRDYECVVYMATMNLNKIGTEQLKRIHGIDEVETNFWQNIYPAYQSAMRGTIRGDELVNAYNIVVLDYKTADTLKNLYFPNAKLNKIGNIVVPVKERKVSVNVSLNDVDRIKVGKILKNWSVLVKEFKNIRSYKSLDKASLVNALKKCGVWDKISARGLVK